MTTTKKETKQDQLNFNQDMLALPLMMTNLVVDYTKKSQELTLGYLKALEEHQRQAFKQTYEQVNQLFPGESKLWEQQRQMIEKSFKMMDSFAQVWK